MNNRPNRTVTSPSGRELVIKEYLTAGERNLIRAVYLNAMSVKPGATAGAPGEVNEVPGAVLIEAERKLIEVAVVSFDKITDTAGIAAALDAGSIEDYDFVVAEVNRTKTGGLTPAK